MTDNQPRRLVTVQEAAEYVGCHQATIRRRLAEGALKRYKFGPKFLRVDLDEIDALMAGAA